ncbi:hypothetical protein T459_04800 [Capsicum annuum]|uniref:DUF4283 domain-containing protein n=1 Tax=Capsicum annuum TaxID=4072 RepID=A0A2G3A620_CAPAN|nr:hypothetical protein T459_04800 [Capsicum annuum]
MQTPTEKKEGNQWGNLFAGNRVASNGMSLKYVTPKRVNGTVVVQLDQQDLEKEESKWKFSLVLYVIGEMPGFNFMKRYIAQQWSAVAKPELYYHDEGYYIVKFQFEPDMKEVFAIGIPLFADECRTKTTRIFYARMLIEVEVTKVIPNEIKNNGCKGEYISTTYLFRLEAKNTVLQLVNDGLFKLECGGVNKRYKQREKSNFMKDHHLNLVRLLDTSVKSNKATGIAQSILDLRTIAAQTTKPWLIWGDFNALLKSQDRVHGAPVTRAEIQEFATCMHDLSLNKLAWKGEYYSWSNK